MPTYQYECLACKHQFEEFQTMSAARLKKCPLCKKDKLERLISGGSGVVFKGSGFYETDYKRKGGTTDTSSSTPSTDKKSVETPVSKPAESTSSATSES